MTVFKDLSVAAAIVSVASGAVASGDVQDYVAGNLPLENGQVIQNFWMKYQTYGELNKDRSNAILVLTAIGANHHRVDYLIGPGKALDTNKYYIVATNAIGNGLTTSPSNSETQHGLAFPRFGIRDMVESQYRLVTEKLGLTHLYAVVGVSMGGMQTLQWGVSHPKMMDVLVPIVPLAKTPAWTKAALELIRQQIMGDPAWANGTYRAPPENGMRLWAASMAMITRTPSLVDSALKDEDGVSWLRKLQDDGWSAIDANNWIYQSWAYAAHDVGMTPGFAGDTGAALQSIQAKTLVIAAEGDLLNPESEAKTLAVRIPHATLQTVAPNGPAGHFTASGRLASEADAQNRIITDFFEANAAKAMTR